MAIIITWLIAIWFTTNTAYNKLTWHKMDKKKDGNSEMSIFTCSVKKKKNTNLAGNYILKEALSKCMKIFLSPTTSYYLHSSDPWKRDKSWRQNLSSRFRQETEAAPFSFLHSCKLIWMNWTSRIMENFEYCFHIVLIISECAQLSHSKTAGLINRFCAELAWVCVGSFRELWLLLWVSLPGSAT